MRGVLGLAVVVSAAVCGSTALAQTEEANPERATNAETETEEANTEPATNAETQRDEIVVEGRKPAVKRTIDGATYDVRTILKPPRALLPMC